MLSLDISVTSRVTASLVISPDSFVAIIFRMWISTVSASWSACRSFCFSDYKNSLLAVSASQTAHHLSQSQRFNGLLRIWHSELSICDMWLLFLPFHDLAHFFSMLTFIAFSLHHWFHSIISTIVALYHHLNPFILRNSNHLTRTDKLLEPAQAQALSASISAIDLTIQSDGWWYTRASHITDRIFLRPRFIHSWNIVMQN